MNKRIHCSFCGSDTHYVTWCWRRKTKKVRPQSDKEMSYQTWKETVARPHLIKRDGNWCYCCWRPAEGDEKLDIEHTKGKGSHPESKRELKNMRLYCRFPCHRNKTDNIPCLH